MPRGRSFRPQRKRIFVGCEGKSEFGYAAFIGLLAEEAGLAVHIDPRKYHGGDPLAIVEAAVCDLNLRSKRRTAYAIRAIFLDADRRGEKPDRSARADRLLRDHGFQPIWSDPTLEALFLKHIPGCEQLDPATPALALRQLQDRWPEYRKGMTAKELRARIDHDAVKRAAAVLPALRTFLASIGLPV